MIRTIVAHPDGKPVLLLGITRDDLARLIDEEQPIIINTSRVVPGSELPGLEVAIYFAAPSVEAQLREQFGDGRVQQTETTEGEPRNDNDNHDGLTRVEREANRRAAKRRTRRGRA